MSIDDMLAGADWVEHIRARSESAACVWGGGVFALLYLTADGRARQIPAHCTISPNDEQRMQMARSAIQDGGNADDIASVLIMDAL